MQNSCLAPRNLNNKGGRHDGCRCEHSGGPRVRKPKTWGLDDEEWMRALSRQRRTAFLTVLGERCSQWRFEAAFEKERKMRLALQVWKNFRERSAERQRILHAWMPGAHSLHYLAFTSLARGTFFWMHFFFHPRSSKPALISNRFKLVIKSAQWLWCCCRRMPGSRRYTSGIFSVSLQRICTCSCF